MCSSLQIRYGIGLLLIGLLTPAFGTTPAVHQTQQVGYLQKYLPQKLRLSPDQVKVVVNNGSVLVIFQHLPATFKDEENQRALRAHLEHIRLSLNPPFQPLESRFEDFDERNIDPLILTPPVAPLKPDDRHQVFHFDQAHLEIRAPKEWFAFNESSHGAGIVYVSREKMIDKDSKFLVGLVVYRDFELLAARSFRDTDELRKIVLPSMLETSKPRTFSGNFEMEGTLGRFQGWLIRDPGGKLNTVACAALKHGVSFFVVMEAPPAEWEKYKPVLMEMLKTMTVVPTPTAGAVEVHSPFSAETGD